MWRQEVNVLFRKPNTQDQEYINEWNLLRPLTAEMFDSIWRRVSDSEFTYDDCTLDGTVMKRGQEQHGFSRNDVDYISMREGRQHGLSVQIRHGFVGGCYYKIYVHKNGE